MKNYVDAKFLNDLFSRHQRPLLLVGQGIKLANAVKELRRVVNKFKIPTLTSRLGIDVIEYDHPSYVGHPGNFGTKPGWLAIDNADLIVAVGCRLSTATINFYPEKWAKNAYVVMVDVDKQELVKHGERINLKINMDAKKFLQDLFQCDFKVSKKWVKLCQDWKQHYPTVTEAMKRQKPASSYYFIEKLAELSDAKDIVIVDTGSCFHIAAQAWKIKKGQRFLTTGGISSMGWWVAALGSSVLGHTILITGDGSLQMNLQELATIKHYHLPIKMFVLNNGGYGLIRASQKKYFGKDNLIGESPKTGVWCPDLKKVAGAYGIYFQRINQADKINYVVRKILRYNQGPAIGEVMVPYWEKILRQDETRAEDESWVDESND